MMLQRLIFISVLVNISISILEPFHEFEVELKGVQMHRAREKGQNFPKMSVHTMDILCTDE